MSGQGHDPYEVLDGAETPAQHDELGADTRWLMSDPHGRNWARRLLRELYAHRCARTPQAAGRQEVGMWLWRLIHTHAQELIPLMWEEESVRDR